VIFTFCNEPFESLYHSIHSVLERSPRHLLKEIVLVDDGSELDWCVVCACSSTSTHSLGHRSIHFSVTPSFSLCLSLTFSH
jgi:hypothetical protein